MRRLHAPTRTHSLVSSSHLYSTRHLWPALCSLVSTCRYNCELIDSYRGFGGVRLEDVVAVAEEGPDCLSCDTPRTTAAIEAAFVGL